jgi:hypothetical protein
MAMINISRSDNGSACSDFSEKRGMSVYLITRYCAANNMEQKKSETYISRHRADIILQTKHCVLFLNINDNF